MIFSIIGDSNVRRFVTNVNIRSCPEIGDAQISSCPKLSMLSEALLQVDDASDAVILTCLTNFLVDTTGSSSVGVRVEPTLTSFRTKIIDACERLPAKQFLVCPPMFRSRPVWFREGLSEILQKFSSVMSQDRSRYKNLFLMPSFSNPVYENDGVHLTPYAGLEYLIHLFDSAKSLIELSKKDTSARVCHGAESTRALEDRMVAVEQGQRLLVKDLEMKTAVDSELACFQENVRNEVYFVISGLRKLPPGLLGREWQDKAKADVQEIIKILLGKELPIVVVQNISGRGQDAEVRYNVRMECAAHSQEIRSKFGYFFTKGVDTRPPALASISIGNRLTAASQIRIAILKLMAKRYQDSNPEGKARVISYEARPMIRILPPQGSSDTRAKNFNYIEAIKKLPTNFSAQDLRPVLLRAGNRFAGKLRSTFVVLDDDMKVTRGVESGQAASLPEPEVELEITDEALVQVQSSSSRGNKRGAESTAGSRSKR